MIQSQHCKLLSMKFTKISYVDKRARIPEVATAQVKS
jgi:hypothetical protein